MKRTAVFGRSSPDAALGRDRFLEARYDALSQEIRIRADKKFALLKENPQHPSLQFKKVGDWRGEEIWSAPGYAEL